MASQAEEAMNPHADLIDTFAEITSASKQEALFFLESHNYDLDSAVSTFLETTHIPTATATAAAATGNSLSPSQSLSPSPSSSPSRSRSPSPPPPLRPSEPASYNLRSRQQPPPAAEKKPSGSRGTGGVRTLSDLNRPARDGSGSDSDEPQEYYTGGEKSGMLVQDPTKRNDVDALFNQARQAGAVEGPADHLRPSSSSRSFTGTARLLSGEAVSTAPQQREPITHIITFWSNGFTVDDGPLRRLNDPENAPFLESIRKSECPKELEPTDRTTPVHVSLMRKEEDCPVQQKRKIPFQGMGRTLGSISSNPVAEPTVDAPARNTAPHPAMGLIVDQALPSTSIQLRLADGTRMVSRFNSHHTIRDIRGFIDASRPGGPRTYQLQTVGFPPKQLADPDQTIEQAGLANSVVIQKL
ncbi:hypothetical protein RJ640_026081 [Escallonia rubra]|uniref:Uncharacterized protein n=1 Tax=Escallonia rubra TaxID=112253 RepID=A0AA88RBA4_9ASTE|nr:hypothetical protein RJ640_026081 [Escallonia rubra]